jgi:hypothetical protein
MNPSNIPADDSAFPAVFVMMSTFIGALTWFCILLNNMPRF